jgi:hypothetical protein
VIRVRTLEAGPQRRRVRFACPLSAAAGLVWLVRAVGLGLCRTNGKRGSGEEYHEWDFTKNHIEVCDDNCVAKFREFGIGSAGRMALRFNSLEIKLETADPLLSVVWDGGVVKVRPNVRYVDLPFGGENQVTEVEVRRVCT